MTVKLSSTATADLLLLSASADQLLGLLGKRANEPGIIEPKDMPAALQALRNLSEPGKADAQAEKAPDAQDDAPKSFQDESVSLRQRAWPLIQMIERAQAAGKPIVWGV